MQLVYIGQDVAEKKERKLLDCAEGQKPYKFFQQKARLFDITNPEFSDSFILGVQEGGYKAGYYMMPMGVNTSRISFDAIAYNREVILLPLTKESFDNEMSKIYKLFEYVLNKKAA